LAVAVLTSLGLLWRGWALPVPAPERSSPAETPVFPVPADTDGVDWTVFRGRAVETKADSGLASRFRLAGTFMAFGEAAGDTPGDARKAILDVLSARTQAIVSEGDTVDGALVVRIFQEGIVLREGEREAQLWLSFARRGGAAAASGAAETGEAEGAAAAESPVNAYGGRQVGPNRWVFQRETLETYYQELMEDPERLLQVFDSLKPIYDEGQKITGYHLGIEGEGEFFNAVGLNEGDVVRRVNSLDMTSRRRAEYFIREFAANRANAFVLDIERGGKPEKLIYQVR
jgi:type II secretory pathway component PulC